MLTVSFANLLISTAGRAFVLMGCVELILLALRRRNASAAQRHLVLLTGVVLLIALPLLSFVLPPKTVVESIVPPAPPSRTSKDVAAPVTAQTLALLNDADRNSSRLSKQQAAQTPIPAHLSAAVEPVDSSPSSVSSDRTSRGPGILVRAANLAYLTGALLVALRFGMAYVRLNRVSKRRYTSLTDSVWLRRIEILASSQGGTPSLRVRRAIDGDISPAFTTPVTFGILKPTLLLPGDAVDGVWADSCTDAVLRHEIAHIQRLDSAAQLLANAACAIYWFNPWVWQQARRLNAAAETACDDRALQAGVEATEYAEHLLFVARAVRRSASIAPWQNLWRGDVALSMARSQSCVEERLSSVLMPHRNRAIVPARTLLAVSAFALLIVAPAAATRRTIHEIHRSAALPPRPDGEVLSILQRVHAATQRMKSMSADFTYTEKTQSTTGEWAARLGGKGQTVEAHIEMMRPNYARVRFTRMTRPAFPNLVASDGKLVYTFTPSSFRPRYHFVAGAFDPAAGAAQASGLMAGGGKITTTPAKPDGANVHLWDATPAQAFFDTIRAVRDWVYVENLNELRYEGRVTIHGTSYQVLEHHIMGESAGVNCPFEQHLYVGPDDLIHGYLLEYTCNGKPATELSWLRNIRGNVALKPSDFAFTPPTAGQ